MPDEDIKTQKPGILENIPGAKEKAGEHKLPGFLRLFYVHDCPAFMTAFYALTMTVWYPALFSRLSIAAASSSVGKVPTVTR